MAGPPGLLAGPAGAVPEAATASPPPTTAPLPRAGTCRPAGRDPAPEETPSAGRQAGRRSSTGSRPRPPAVPRAMPVSAWLRRTTNRTPTFTLMPRSASWLRRRLSVLGGGDHGWPLEAEDRPLPLRPPPPLPHRPQAVAAAADPTRPDPTRRQPSGRAVRTPWGGRSPCPAQHEGVSDRDHGAQLRTLRVVVLAAVFTPCKQTSSVRADGEGRGAPKGRREAPCRMGLPGSAPHKYETVRTQDVPPRNTPSMQSHPQGDRERDLPEEWR